MNYAALKVRLDAGHPVTGAFDADHAMAAVQFHVVNRSRPVATVEGQEVFEAVDPADFGSLSDAQKALLYAIVGMGSIQVNGPNTRGALLAMFASGTETRANLAALQTEAISLAVELAEELGSSDIKAGHIQRARALA